MTSVPGDVDRQAGRTRPAAAPRLSAMPWRDLKYSRSAPTRHEQRHRHVQQPGGERGDTVEPRLRRRVHDLVGVQGVEPELSAPCLLRSVHAVVSLLLPGGRHVIGLAGFVTKPHAAPYRTRPCGTEPCAASFRQCLAQQPVRQNRQPAGQIDHQRGEPQPAAMPAQRRHHPRRDQQRHGQQAEHLQLPERVHRGASQQGRPQAGGRGGAHRLGHARRAQPPRHRGQRAQMLGIRRRAEQQEHQIDRPPVHRVEGDRPVQPGEEARTGAASAAILACGTAMPPPVPVEPSASRAARAGGDLRRRQPERLAGRPRERGQQRGLVGRAQPVEHVVGRDQHVECQGRQRHGGVSCSARR